MLRLLQRARPREAHDALLRHALADRAAADGDQLRQHHRVRRSCQRVRDDVRRVSIALTSSIYRPFLVF